MVFVDAPIGFLGEKLIPFLGDFRNIDVKSYQRNRATISKLSVLIYNAFLKESPEATKAITQGTVNFYGEYVTTNM